MTLVILAAGMGSRFGGLKQIEPVGPNGEFIIDYSIYDAIKAGFNEVVFIIKEEHYDLFRDTIGKRIEGKIDVKYVFQDMSNVPSDIKIPKDRVKPLGTAQALMFCKDVVKNPFVIINADDFYGYDAYKTAYNFLSNIDADAAMVSYLIGNTITKNGKVKRGYCYSENGYLTDILESSVYYEDNKIIVEPMDGSDKFIATSNDLVSMNLFCFKPEIIDNITNYFHTYLKENINNLETCEYLITNVIRNRINNENYKLKILDTKAVWHGVTYKEDKQELVDAINELIEKGEYPNNLYK